MIGQRQLVTSSEIGDCFRACVASVMELPNGDHMPNKHDSFWFKTWTDWLGQFGLTLGHASSKGPIWKYEGFWIASVKSKNYNTAHAIVMHDTDKVAFDPSNKKRYRRGTRLNSDIVLGGSWFEVCDFSLLHKLDEYRKSLVV